MKDLTQGSVARNLMQIAAFLAASMLLQTLYLLVDMYWVGRLGKEAIAAVGLAGTVSFIVLALTQALGVGTTTLVAHAVGAKDQARARRVFNQSLVLSILSSGCFLAVAFALRGAYCRALAADAETVRLGEEYLAWFLPALALQFAVVSMGSALRGTGIVKPTVIIQIITVLLNIVLAPVLIFGWGTGLAMGVTGAALSTFVAVVLGFVLLVGYFLRADGFITFDRAAWAPDLRIWKRMMAVGAPAGGEFLLISLHMILVYRLIQGFGAAAQAGFGIGSRVMQSLFLPVVAIAFAASPVVGQNFGARLADRVRETFRWAAVMASAVMMVLTVLCHISPAALIRPFSSDPAVILVGGEYLRITSWNFVPSAIVFTSSSIFQGIGNSVPPVIISAARLLLFAVPAFLLSRTAGFELRQIWYVGVAAVIVQMTLNIWLLQREFRRRLTFGPTAVPAPAP
ncbi:MAG TPA: MATE family efflux transporter [Vicinamibacterales bacterium]|jgi:putative MATE family efflux protein|nr:MATE family efflux transporter [Vicinamibacterales bacterium]